MAITDLTNTTWVLKPSLITYPGGTYTKKQYNVNITTSEAIDPITPASGYDPKTNFTYISIGYNSGGEYNEIGLDQNNFPYYQIAHGNDTKTLPDTWSSYYQGTFTITGGTDATNSTLISWLETNATQQIIDISITYEDTEIATMSESGTKTLKTSGKYCTDDITIEYTKHEIVPNLQVKTNIAPTTSSQTITADSGYDGLSSVQINAMPNGTAGTPTATKGTVSNHSISVTPSVTNTTGYITGGTKTGTAVTVSASELVSGTLSITSSGTKDVTNYASASVAAGSVTSPGTISGTSATVSTGTNTLTLSKTVSVTPSVTTAGYISAGTAGNASVSLTANVTTKGATTYGLSTSDATIASGTYLTGAQTIKGITGGTYTATSNSSGIDIKNYSSLTVAVPSDLHLQDNKTVTPTVAGLTVTPDTGYNGLAQVTINGITTMTLPTTTSGTGSGTNKASISQGATDKYINIPTGYNENAANYLIPAYTAQTLPSSTSGTSSGTSKATITPSTSVQYLNIPTGYQATAQYYTVSGITTMTLPSSTSGTSSGTNKATLTPSTSAQYLNIPTGYNSSAQYYTISGITTMTLPTAASGTSSGTNKATIGRSTSDQYINIPTGYNSSAANYKISAVANGSATTPARTITPTITRVIDNPTGVVSISVSGSSSITPTVSAGYVSAGTAGTVNVSGSTTLTLTTQAAQTITPTTTDQTIAANRWLTGTQTIKGDTNLLAENIKKDVVIFGVTGTLEGGSSIQPPVGAILITSTNSNPENLGYEGTWTLINKEFADFTGTQTDNSFFTPNTGVTLVNNTFFVSNSGGMVVTRSGNIITIQVRLNYNSTIGSTDVVLGTFDLSKLGLSSIPYTQTFMGWSEGGNAIIMAVIYGSSNANMGQFRTANVITKDTSGTMAASQDIMFTFNIEVPSSSMLDSVCDKFYWEKTTGSSDYLDADTTVY